MDAQSRRHYSLHSVVAGSLLCLAASMLCFPLYYSRWPHGGDGDRTKLSNLRLDSAAVHICMAHDSARQDALGSPLVPLPHTLLGLDLDQPPFQPPHGYDKSAARKRVLDALNHFLSATGHGSGVDTDAVNAHLAANVFLVESARTVYLKELFPLMKREAQSVSQTRLWHKMLQSVDDARHEAMVKALEAWCVEQLKWVWSS